MIAGDWKRVEKNTLQGFCTLETPSGIIFRDVVLHQRDSQRWIALPSKPWVKSDGSTSYTSLVEFRDTVTKNAFQRQALEAIDVMLAEVAP